MVTIKCDGCGKQLSKGSLRYTVKINVQAAYDEMEVGLLDLVRNHRAEMLRLIEQMKEKDPKEIEDSVHKAMSLDLCPRCQRAYIADPLHFHPERGQAPDFDVEAFLRSLGYDNDAGDA